MNSRTKSALAASVGGALEWYDFIIYGFFSEVLGRQFFPSSNEYSQTLLIFSLFAVGYIARAAGGLFFGSIGDRHGRSVSLSSTMFVGGIATVCMAIMPNYQQLGIVASLLFMLARVVQGLTIGVNISGAIVYISELTDKKSRGFWVSTVFLGTQRGVMLAGGVSALLLSYLSHDQLHHWGWRLAFLVGILVMLLAWYSKDHLIETPYHLDLRRAQKVSPHPIRLLFSQYKAEMVVGMCLTAIFSISLTFMMFYMPTFLREYKFTPPEIIHSTFFNIFIFSAVLPIFGWVSDRIGPRRLLKIASAILVLDIYSCTNLIIQQNPIPHYLGLAVLSINLAAIATTTPVILVGLFPTSVRYSGVSFSYNLCNSFSVGVSPLLFTIIAHRLHSERGAIACLFIASALISFIALYYAKVENDWLHIKEESWEQNDVH